MLALLGTLFVLVTGLGIWLLRPKSKKLQRAAWLLLAVGVLLFVVSVLVFTYAVEGIDDVEPGYDLPPSWAVASVIGAGIGFASVVMALVVVIFAKLRKA